MRIAVVGAGGVGGGFGADLAKAGADVTFIARGAHLAAMKSQGLKVQGPRGETHLVPTQATDDPASVGKVDIVLFCVKLWDIESAGAHIKPGNYEEGNGITHVNILRTIEAMYGLGKSGAQQPNALGAGIGDDQIITDVFEPIAK